MDPADLERLIDVRLRQLPPPRAPATLVPRVLQAVERRSARPWYMHAWFDWPLGWRLVSIGMFALTLGAALVWSAPAYDWAAGLVARVSSDALDHVSPIARHVEPFVAAAQVLWRALVQPIVPYALGLAIVVSVACALAGTALTYLVLGKAIDQ